MINLLSPNIQTHGVVAVPPARQAFAEHQQCAPAGAYIFTAEEMGEQQYLLVSGQVVILRDGRIVDVVESGELLDPALWPGAVAVAWHTSFLQPLRRKML